MRYQCYYGSQCCHNRNGCMDTDQRTKYSNYCKPCFTKYQYHRVDHRNLCFSMEDNKRSMFKFIQCEHYYFIGANSFQCRAEPGSVFVNLHNTCSEYCYNRNGYMDAGQRTQYCNYCKPGITKYHCQRTYNRCIRIPLDDQLQ